MKPPIPTITPELRVRVTCSGLNVRAGAGTAYNRVKTMIQGEEAQVFEARELSGQVWARVATSNLWIAVYYGGQTLAIFFTAPVVLPPISPVVSRLKALVAEAKRDGIEVVSITTGDLQDVLDMVKG